MQVYHKLNDILNTNKIPMSAWHNQTFTTLKCTVKIHKGYNVNFHVNNVILQILWRYIQGLYLGLSPCLSKRCKVPWSSNIGFFPFSSTIHFLYHSESGVSLVNFNGWTSYLRWTLNLLNQLNWEGYSLNLLCILTQWKNELHSWHHT